MPWVRGHPGYGWSTAPPPCFSASSPSSPFCISANLGNQTRLVDCFPTAVVGDSPSGPA